ncbi:MAG: hypothetical protein F6K24_35475, partial [Okeania sp. SIO2D1]|nr:hypothetical protein [Okeania sp. SIO2D1]
MKIKHPNIKDTIILLSILNVSSFLIATPASSKVVTQQWWRQACVNSGGVVKKQLPRMGARQIPFLSCIKNGKQIAPKNLPVWLNLQVQAIDLWKHHHKDQGEDPFSAIFTSNISLLPNLPSDITLTLNPSSSTSSLTGPPIWGNELINTSITEAQISVNLEQESGQLNPTSFSFKFDSFDINGIPSGQNNIFPKTDSNGRFSFNSTTGEFD